MGEPGLDPTVEVTDRVPLLRAGGELLVVDRQSFPYIDLRVDSDPDPIAALAKLWRDYAPLAENFVERATEPDTVVIPPT